MIKFVIPDDAILRELDANAPIEQVREVQASHGKDIYTVAKAGMQVSLETWAAIQDDKLLCVVGLVPQSLMSDVASPWLLTAGVDPKLLMRGTRVFLDQWTKEYRLLYNYVDARYEASLRWAKWAGFTIHEAMPYGYEGLPFHKIEIRN